MKMTFKTKLAVVSIAFLTTFAVTSCKNHPGHTTDAVHTMGPQKSGYMMHNDQMPTR